MRILGARGLTRVLCEGGGRLSAALLEAGLVDEVVLYTAGVVLGDEGTPSVGPLRVEALADAPRLRLVGTARIGDDARSRWVAATSPAPRPIPRG